MWLKSPVQYVFKKENIVNYSHPRYSSLATTISRDRFPSKSFNQSFFRRFYPIVPFYLADLAEGIADAEIIEWNKKEKDPIDQMEQLCTVQTDKATVPISSPYKANIVKLYYKAGDIAKVGTKLCDFDVSAEDYDGSEVTHHVAETKAKEEEQVVTKIEIKAENIILATPAVRFLAKKNAVDLSQIIATGREGRITKGDIIEYLRIRDQPKQPIPPKPATITVPFKSTVESAVVGKEEDLLIKEVVPLRGYHRAMARSMAQSLSIPHLGYCDEIYMDKLIEFRKTLKPLADQRNIKLSYMPFIIKACSLAMKRFPLINSRINNDLTEITLITSHNIAIAIATEFGLAVPNIKNVQDLTLFEVAEKLSQIIDRASSNKLTPQDLQAPTFSLSNIGVIGGTYASPVLVVPQVCIGAIGKVHKLPRYNSKNEIYPASLMNISWSADHRVIDGATIANFSNLVKQYLEEPLAMLLDSK